MKQPNVTVYGTKSCEDTTRLRQQLDARGMAYEYRDLDEFPEFASYIAGLNGGHRITPTVRLDNQTLINPSEHELAEAYERASTARH